MQCKNQECGKEFAGNKKQVHFCCPTCRTRYWTIHTVKRREKEIEEKIKNRINQLQNIL